MDYLLSSALLTCGFYLFYQLFLKRETFFQWTRFYFLGGMLISVLLPLYHYTEYVYLDVNQFLPASEASGLSQATVQDESSLLDLVPILFWTIYLTGLVVLLGRFAAQVFSLHRFLRGQRQVHEGRYKMIATRDKDAAFSFFSYIIYPIDAYGHDELQKILEHEKKHADEWHSIDVILSELFCCFFWMNPLTWFYKNAMEGNLEYIADTKPYQMNQNSGSYERLLLKSVKASHDLSLISRFNQSTIKKRIKMLHMKKSNKLQLIKFLMVLPLLALFIFQYNNRVIAMPLSTENTIDMHEEEMEVITKDFSKADLTALQSRLMKSGITMTFKRLKFNDANEITGISISLENGKGYSANHKQSGDEPITPISIRFNPKTGTLSLGNMAHEEMDNHFVHEDVEVHKDIKIKTKNKEVIVISGGEGGKTIKVSADGQVNVEDIEIDADGENVWVSKSGDTTMVKHIKIIKKDGDSESVEIDIDSDEIDIQEGNGMVFLNSDGGQPLILVDGEEKSESFVKNLGHDQIETMEILKGDAAVKKYGDKAKDGVVVIKTKK